MTSSACAIASRMSASVAPFTISASMIPGGFTMSWIGERAGATAKRSSENPNSFP